MRDDEARALFRGEERFNCAQAVLATFGAETSVIAGAAKCGGGKAPGGVCGAVHAARTLLGGTPSLADLERAFEDEAGSLLCREIRAGKRLPCSDCVALTARLVEATRRP